MNKRKTYFNTLLTGTIAGIVATLTLYWLYMESIIATMNEMPDVWIVILILLIRMGLLAGMSAYMFLQWFKQEEQYVSDIPFLFGAFFLMVFFGKAIDLLYDLTYFQVNTATFLLIFKIRYTIAVLSLLPMYFLSIGMILFYLSLNEKYKKLGDKDFFNQTRVLTLIIIASVEMIFILLLLDENTARIILPAIVIPSFITIVLIFYFSYRNQRLSQVNPLILTFGFGAYLISQILRPVAHVIYGESIAYVFTAELIDLIIYLVIFLGLILKIDYARN